MAITTDDLHPGLELYARNQGRCISPIAVKVIIHWVGPNAVHYKLKDDNEIKETTIERFLEIVNM